MKTAAILINGVSLPYQVLDKGIDHVKETGSSIKAVIIYQNNDDDERYIFPSDIELSKNKFSESDAEKSLLDLITHNQLFINTYYKKHNVVIDTVVLQNPSMKDINLQLSNTDKIFMDPETFRHPEEPAYVNFTYDEFVQKFSPKIEWCIADS